MNLTDFLEKLQQKPRPMRVLIMWIGVAIFMAGFFVLWIATSDFNADNQKIAVPNGNKIETGIKSFSEIRKEVPTLWQSLTAGVSDLFKLEKEQFQGQGDEQNTSPKLEVEPPSASIPEQVPPSALP